MTKSANTCHCGEPLDSYEVEGGHTLEVCSTIDDDTVEEFKRGVEYGSLALPAPTPHIARGVRARE